LRKYDARGNLIFKTGGKGKQNGFFSIPYSVASNGKEIVVSDVLGLQFFDEKGNFLRAIGERSGISRSTQIWSASDLQLDSAGRLYAANLNFKTKVYDSHMGEIGELPQTSEIQVANDATIFCRFDESVSAYYRNNSAR
jgi:hypothetical protein